MRCSSVQPASGKPPSSRPSASSSRRLWNGWRGSPPAALRRCLRVACLVPAIALAQHVAPEHPSGWLDRQPVASRHWMVAAANPQAARAGYAILARGGSAVDAAVAVQLVLGLVEPQSSGIGGGAFMLLHDARAKRLVAYDGRETAPAAAKPDRFLRDGKPLEFYDAVVGGRSVGVPGTVRLLETVHRKYGRLAWTTLFEPAIALAENGFAMSPRLHALLAAERYMTQPRLREYFFDANGGVLPVGTTLRNPAYARTLRAIAAGGADAFYAGEIAHDIVDTVDRHPFNPGDITLADLANYRVVVREPVCDAYREYRVCGFPMPSSGGITVLQVLKMIERFDVAAMQPAGFWSVHLMSEAGRLAFADRSVYIADPAFFTPPAGLLDDAYLRARSALIRPDSSMRRALPGNPPERERAVRKTASGADTALDLPSTSHISIVDRFGNALAMTTTIENQFGSRLMTRGGFLLNNELTDFSFVPEDNGKPVANRVEGGKRPRSSMAPTIAYDRLGRVAIVTGSPGGSAIINYVSKVLLAIIDWDLDPQAAIALPNFGSRNGPTEVERGTGTAELAPKLRALGADVRVIEMTSGAQAIVRTNGGWIGGTDPRREGLVMGQ
ncbi:MAG: gamma-glutamyltransferase [Burkholderiales bacterium]|nr:gamma-glutamyltransferase [Burkholderiales bacterium]